MAKKLTNDLENIIELLYRKTRSPDELEYLISYLMFLADFRKYASNTTKSSRKKLSKALYVEHYLKDQIIFRKGDSSDKFYIIIFGAVDAYNQDKDGTLAYFGTLYPGKQIGERGLVRSQPRSLTMITKEDTYLLTLNAEDFIVLLSKDVFKLLERKLHFIEKFFPNVRKYTYVKKERIAYSMSLEDFKRSQHVIIKGSSNEFLYFISEGELALSLEFGDKITANVVKLGPGNCFGEECVLMGMRSYYNVVVLSERALLYVIRRNDVYNVLPEEVIDTWKTNFELKEKGRRMLIDSTRMRLRNSSPDIRTPSENKYFPQASSYAKKRLNEINIRGKASTPTTSQTKNKTPEPVVRSYKFMLEVLREPISKEETSLNTTKNRSASPIQSLAGTLFPRPLMSKTARSNLYLQNTVRNRIRRKSPIGW